MACQAAVKVDDVFDKPRFVNEIRFQSLSQVREEDSVEDTVAIIHGESQNDGVWAMLDRLRRSLNSNHHLVEFSHAFLGGEWSAIRTDSATESQ
jgi:hypothetical protein